METYFHYFGYKLNSSSEDNREERKTDQGYAIFFWDSQIRTNLILRAIVTILSGTYTGILSHEL